jgi:hypothetical protein
MFKKLTLIIAAVLLFLFTSYAQDASNIFPKDNDIKGWVKSGKARIFAGDKLWEYIDGAAESYYPFGFKKVTTQDYKNGDKQAVVDIYEFKDPKNTFGIYSMERDAKYNFVSVGVQGYLEGTALNFWKGNYYIKLVTFSKKNAKDDLMGLAKAVEKKISGKFSEPDAVKLFPKKNLQVNSIKYFAKDLMGQSFFYNGYIADYAEGKEKYQVFILDAGSQQNAQKFYSAYKNYITQSKGFGKDIQGIGSGAFTGKAIRKNVVAFYNAKIMGGVINVNDEKKAIAIIKELAGK